MNIYILDPSSLDRLAIVNTYTAFSWSRKWGESGAFQLWAPLDEDNSQFLIQENLVWVDNQTCVGVISNVHKYIDEDTGLPLIEISGEFIAADYLHRRIIWGNELMTASPSQVIQALVEHQATDCADTDRILGSTVQSNIHIGSVPQQSNITYCNSYGNLWEEVKSLCLDHGLDLEFQYVPTANISQLTGIISGGVNRSQEVIISTELGCFINSSYITNRYDYCNTALVAGEGEGFSRTTVEIVGADTKLSRRELYVDARDLQTDSSEEPMTADQYRAALLQRGQQHLTEYPVYTEYECSLNLSGQEGYVFGVDYDLGDTISVLDTTLHCRLSATVKEYIMSEDEKGLLQTLVFGVSIPTITELVKRRS